MVSIKELKAKNRNRNLYIALGMTAGAVGGFLISRKMTDKTWIKAVATIAGSFAVGLPILYATKAEQEKRRKMIEGLKM